MKIIVLIIIVLSAVAGYLYFKMEYPKIFLLKLYQPKISRQQALENVNKLPEVQGYLKNIPNGKIEVDNEQKPQQQQSYKTYSEQFKPEMPSGIVSGKICYPSEVIPKGKLEIKRLLDDYVMYEDYPGNIEGVATYSFQLNPGDYYIRYKVTDNLIGYSTTVYPTWDALRLGKGKRGDTEQRELTKATVKPDETISNYDLCDYYYKDSNAPKF